MKIVIDTNCLVRILPKNSPYRYLWDAFRQGKYRLCYSTEILKEYEEILLRFNFPESVMLIMEMLTAATNGIATVPYFKWNLITADPDDNKFVDCAISANADYIVTNDKHFNILKMTDFPKINVINIEQFIKIITLPHRP